MGLLGKLRSASSKVKHAFTDVPEGPKKVLSGSILHALARNAVHIVPMASLVYLIQMNYRTLFIGPTFIENPDVNRFFLASLQFCAKVEELFCVASLGVIVLHALRSQLLGDGVPLGLLGSGIWFSSFGAFFTRTFYSSFKVNFQARWLNPWKWPSLQWHWPSERARRNACFYLLLILCGLVALTIGPASAILMLPRYQEVPAGGATFYLYGAHTTFCPNNVTAKDEPNICAGSNATGYDMCPSGGSTSLRATLGAFDYLRYRDSTGAGVTDYAPLRQAIGAEGSREWFNFLVQSPMNLVPPLLNSVHQQSPRLPIAEQPHNTVMQPHAASVVMMQQLRAQWMTGALRSPESDREHQYKWTYDLETLGSAMVPHVRTRCSTPQNLSAAADSALFPFLAHSLENKTTAFPPFDRPGNQQYSMANLDEIDRSPTSSVRAQWVTLAPDSNHSGDALLASFSPTGLLIELPWLATSRAAIACTTVAAWHNATIHSQRSVDYSAWNIQFQNIASETWASTDSDLTLALMTLDETWLQLLTPTIETQRDSRPATTLEHLLEDVHIQDIPSDIRDDIARSARNQTSRSGMCNTAGLSSAQSDTELWQASICNFDKRPAGLAFMEQIISATVADGLSRFASWRVFDISSNSSRDWSPWAVPSSNRSGLLQLQPYDADTRDRLTHADSFPGWMAVWVLGYGYYPSSKSDYLALFGVCVYLALASSYIIYSILSVMKKRSGTSKSWKSVTELLVLCQNSPPPIASDTLNNSGAGISDPKTYRSVVKIRAVPPADGLGAPKLRLVLDGEYEARVMEEGFVSAAQFDPRDRTGSEEVLLVDNDAFQISRFHSASTHYRSTSSTSAVEVEEKIQIDVKYG